jgi:HlyD family secretion protein
MKLAELKGTIDPATHAPVRGTEAQDKEIEGSRSAGRRRVGIYAASAGALVVIGAVAWLAHAWMNSRNVVSRERLRTATVEKGHFVRDVAAQGVVIAAVNPTLFAIAPGTISYTVHAGDAVTKGKVLAVLESPALKNEYQRERATLDSLDAALARQKIEIRRETLTSQQQADISKVSITAAQREMKRAQWAWDQKAISERDYKRAQDDVATAQLNFDHARDTATLEKDSLALDLRTRTLERERQALVVEDLKQRVDELTVRSPVDGMVANLAQVEKAKVADSAPLLTVVDLTAFEIEFRVAETYAGEIKPAMAAEITLGGRTEAGTVTAISPEVRQNEVIGRVKFAKGQPAGLRQNERASVRIVLDERDAVLKFERGSMIDEATRAVYLMRDNRAIRVPVELGAASITEIEALRGLAAGDQVIISDTRDFNDAPQVMISN